MVTLPQAIASNKRISTTLPDGLVAVFVGGTSGVGEYTVKAFAKYAPNPRVYIVGRSQEAADRIIKECQQLDGGGKFEFIMADVSLLKSVDQVCSHIKIKETAINILFETQGNMAYNKITSEGLPLASGIVMHGRTRFILNLLPLLQKAQSLRRVVCVLAGSYEGHIDTNNIPALGVPMLEVRNQMSSIQTLLLEEAARRAPDVSFVHNVPGIVKGGILREAEPSFRLSVMLAITGLLAPLIQTSPDECAERHVFLATSAKYAPRQGGAAIAGVAVDNDLAVARGSDGRIGSGVYTINTKGESSPVKIEKLLEGFRNDGTARKVWEYVSTDFVKITGTEVA
ncbi:putative short-chain dehydrogenases/reductase [Melanomma pulvis-pyrius CBS 109.77]|uniref:Putative short-chain dehydrogenases/reductase n=1 Tax=Melanomma pulvis-pyrius CBS 109.77 TaxID=1314802 RepID=A0A6A6X9Z3_9PLEO|nr:putative short-chain dehydrogenases/reductase [Melanomma pulvis-pyrius CBS 109.77]